MARQKQTPLQREPSDFNRGPPESPTHGWRPINGSTGKTVAIKDSKPAQLEPSEHPGLIQLGICIAGIYTSLYVLTIFPSGCTANASQIASLGLSFRNV